MYYAVSRYRRKVKEKVLSGVERSDLEKKDCLKKKRKEEEKKRIKNTRSENKSSTASGIIGKTREERAPPKFLVRFNDNS